MKNNYLAISLKVLSVIFFVLMDVLIKKLSSNFDTIHIVFFRCFFGLFPVLVMVVVTKSPLRTSQINLRLLSAIIACLAMVRFFTAYWILPIADVFSIICAFILFFTICLI